MPESKVESLATGWAWNGDRAKELGLIDEIGTFDQALDAAAARGGIKGDYSVVEIEDDQFDDLFGSLLRLSQRLDRLGALAESREATVRRSLPR
jgi:protease-4